MSAAVLRPRLCRSVLAGALGLALAAGCAGPPPRPRALAGPVPPAARAAAAEEPLPPHWVLFASWRSDHGDLARLLEAEGTTEAGREALFRSCEERLRRLGQGLPPEEGPRVEAFLRRYATLREEAAGGGDLGGIRGRLDALAREIRERWSEPEPRALSLKPRTSI